MLNTTILNTLRGEKNLLAFSAGVDSTTLFFLLLDADINFDIAIVNYNTREQSRQEVSYAQELSLSYKKTCHLLNAPNIHKNFEAEARKIRYDFFEETIEVYQYQNLLTAHHLGDRFEWMLMQFCKGAGCVELAGMTAIEKREKYALVRPLLGVDKSELLEYLNANNLHYFEDETNKDETISRNAFRHQHAKPLLEKHLKGIKKSFEYIDADRDLLDLKTKINRFENLYYFTRSQSLRSDIVVLDKHFKQNNYLISANERELLKENESVVLGRKYLVSTSEKYIFITPYKKSTLKMEKNFKEACRILKIDTKLRPFLYENKKVFSEVKRLLLLS